MRTEPLPRGPSIKYLCSRCGVVSSYEKDHVNGFCTFAGTVRIMEKKETANCAYCRKPIYWDGLTWRHTHDADYHCTTHATPGEEQNEDW